VYYLLYLERYKPDVIITLDGVNNGPELAFPQDPHYPRKNRGNARSLWYSTLDAPTLYSLTAHRRQLSRPIAELLATPNNIWRTPEALAWLAKTFNARSGPRAESGRSIQHEASLADVLDSHYEQTIRRFALLTKSEGARYLAVLQPNAGYAKPLSPEEQGDARRWPDYTTETGQWVLLLDKAAPSIEKNIRQESRDARLLNLTKLFARTSATRYVDFCHYNDAAQDEIAEQLFLAVARWLRSSPQPRPDHRSFG
jgi:hypothetical protein